MSNPLGRTAQAGKLHAYQVDAYLRSLSTLLDALAILEHVKTQGWTQAVQLNEVFTRLTAASEHLGEVSPADLSPALKRRLAELS